MLVMLATSSLPCPICSAVHCVMVDEHCRPKLVKKSQAKHLTHLKFADLNVWLDGMCDTYSDEPSIEEKLKLVVKDTRELIFGNLTPDIFGAQYRRQQYVFSTDRTCSFQRPTFTLPTHGW